jgi:outer membrane protein assembly factor BamB
MDWPSHRYDANNTGHNPDAVLPHAYFETVWTAEVQSSTAHGVLANGVAYHGSGHNNLYATDVTSGERLWQLDVRLESSPAVADGMVYLTHFDGPTLLAVDARTGERRWQAGIGSFPDSPTVRDGTVYVGTCRSFHAFDAKTGAPRWQATPESCFQDNPAADGDAVYIGDRADVLHAFDKETGAQLWQYQTEDEVNTAPAVANETVYFGSQDETVYAVHATNGTGRWAVDVGHYDIKDLVVAHGTVVLQTRDTVYALDAKTGTLEWKRDDVDGYLPPVVAGQTVLVHDSPDLLGIDLASGAHQWTYHDGGGSSGEPMVGRGTIVFPDYDGWRGVRIADYGVARQNGRLGATATGQRATAADRLQRLRLDIEDAEGNGYLVNDSVATFRQADTAFRDAEYRRAAVLARESFETLNGTKLNRTSAHLTLQHANDSDSLLLPLSDRLGRASALQTAKRAYDSGEYQVAETSARRAIRAQEQARTVALVALVVITILALGIPVFIRRRG